MNGKEANSFINNEFNAVLIDSSDQNGEIKEVYYGQKIKAVGRIYESNTFFESSNTESRSFIRRQETDAKVRLTYQDKDGDVIEAIGYKFEEQPREQEQPVLIKREETEAEVRLTYQDKDGQIIEAIGCKFEPPREQEQPVLIKREETEAEVRLTYQDKDGQIIEAIGCKFEPSKEQLASIKNDKSDLEEELLLKREELVKKFKLSQQQFLLCHEFFLEKSSNLLLDIKVLGIFLKQALKNRPQIKITEQDVDKELENIDTDKDKKINFEQFIQMMSLVFAKKSKEVEK